MNTLSILAAALSLQGTGTKPKAVTLDIFQLKGTARTELKPGDSLGGDTVFRVVVNTTSPVQQVEMYVDGTLRETDGSIPYEFHLDTLGEKDGSVSIKFLGVTSEGERAEKTIGVKIDNGVALGAAANVEKALAAFRVANYDDAIFSNRVALKADANYVPAMVLMSKSYLAKKVYDRAQKYAEDAIAIDKGNRDARGTLAAVRVYQATNTFSRKAGDRKDTIANIKRYLEEGIKLSNGLLADDIAASAGDPMGNLHNDLLLKAGRYPAVISNLKDVVSKDYSDTGKVNRYVYALLKSYRFEDAEKGLRDLAKFGEMDSYSYALSAVLQTEMGNNTAADNAIREALLVGSDSLGLMSAQSYIALKRNDDKALRDANRGLAKEGERTEALYFISALSSRTGNYQKSRETFEKALQANPADGDMYIQQGIEAIQLSYLPSLKPEERSFQYAYAKGLFELALKCNESSAQALAGISIAAMYQKDYKTAQSYADAATRARANYAAGWYCLAGSSSVNKLDARETLKKASALDVKYLGGRSMPGAEEMFKYFSTAGRVPVITPPSRG
jgi:tetratricopeptide (TPR) repeat protein